MCNSCQSLISILHCQIMYNSLLHKINSVPFIVRFSNISNQIGFQRAQIKICKTNVISKTTYCVLIKLKICLCTLIQFYFILNLQKFCVKLQTQIYEVYSFYIAQNIFLHFLFMTEYIIEQTKHQATLMVWPQTIWGTFKG